MSDTTAPSGLDPKVLEKLRAKLVSEHARLTDVVLAIAQDRAATMDRQGPGDAVDDATPQELGDTHDSLLARARVELVEIERALERMDDGTYGFSERTKAPIPLARLEAIPWATV